MNPVTIIGSYISPYVRKVLACLDIKQIPYVIDPIVPFFGNDEFTRLSPLRRIPVLIDGDVTLCDSTVICEYLDERYPEPAVYPRPPGERARARWLEEYADTRLGDVFIWHYFNQLVIRRAVWRETPDDEVLNKAVTEEIPQSLTYLESQVPVSGFLFAAEKLSVADVAIASILRNAQFARFAIDPQRWPTVAAYVDRVLATPSLSKLRRFEDLLMRTPIEDIRKALLAEGAPLTETTLAQFTPHRSMMPI